MQPETNKPQIKTSIIKLPSGNWEVRADVNGRFFSSASCKSKADALKMVKQDLAEGGLKP